MATIGHVAARAGVSRATVSRVVNNPASVSEATRQRVQRAIEALRYRPSARARDLSLGRNRSVAILTRSPRWQLSLPLAGRFSEDGFDVTFVEASSGVATALAVVVDRVGGAVVQGGVAPDAAAEVMRYEIPVVATGPGDIGLNRVVIDHSTAVDTAARYLAATGHSTVALFDDGELTNSEVADLRLIFGVRGLRLRRPIRQLDSLAAALSARGAPTAVLAATPLIALRTHNEARALGYLIPHELSIVAMGSVAATRAMRISAIERPVERAAQCSAELLETLMGSVRRRSPGIEVRLAATFVPGVTTRRAA